MIYVPNLDNYECVVVRSEEIIRAYEELPRNNSESSYRDFYYNSNYYFNDGVQTFSQYTTLPSCIDNSNLTDDIWYRNDFDKILIIFLILFIFIVYFPLKIIFRFIKRR